MSQTNNLGITWSIDRIPDYNTLSHIQDRNMLRDILGLRFRRVELCNIVRRALGNDYPFSVDSMRELTSGDTIITRELSNTNRNVNDDDDNYTNNRNNIFLQNFSNISNSVFEGTANWLEDEFIPFTITSESNSQSINYIVDEFIISTAEADCCICMECCEHIQICKLNCQHTFCISCIDQHLERNYNCPLCRQHISQITIQTMEARQQIHH